MKEYTIGIISDTHGLLRDEISDIFKDVKFIIHAGDIGGNDIVKKLQNIAPTVFVKGNTDVGDYAKNLKHRIVLNLDHFEILIAHDYHSINIEKLDPLIKIVIFGHSHRPLLEEKNGVLFLNPGSAGPRRFNLPISCAILKVKGSHFSAELIDIPKSEKKHD